MCANMQKYTWNIVSLLIAIQRSRRSPDREPNVVAELQWSRITSGVLNKIQLVHEKVIAKTNLNRNTNDILLIALNAVD